MSKTTITELEQSANTVLHRCATIFPFKIFPTTIEVTPTKVSIKEMILPFSSTLNHILIKDLVNVQVETNPFFARLQFEIRFKEKNPNPISFLEKESAKELANIVTGLIEARGEDVDVSDVGDPVEREKLRSAGDSQTL